MSFRKERKRKNRREGKTETDGQTLSDRGEKQSAEDSEENPKKLCPANNKEGPGSRLVRRLKEKKVTEGEMQPSWLSVLVLLCLLWKDKREI